MITRKQFVDRWNSRHESTNRCFYCGRFFSNMNLHGPYLKTVEHLISQMELEGKSAIANKVKACAGCNNAKNGGTVLEFRNWLGSQFYCERILNVDYPYHDNSVWGNGQHTFHLIRLVNEFHKKNLHHIRNTFDGRLKKKLEVIVRETKNKVLYAR